MFQTRASRAPSRRTAQHWHWHSWASAPPPWLRMSNHAAHRCMTGSRIKEGRGGRSDAGECDYLRTARNQWLGQSIGDVLQQLSGSGSSLNTKFNSSGNFRLSARWQRRGCGFDHGRSASPRRQARGTGRWHPLVSESSASGVSPAVDLKHHSISIVERIGSAGRRRLVDHGSDAIAGVVNVITRRDLEGGLVNLYYGQWDEGDGETASGVSPTAAAPARASFSSPRPLYDRKESCRVTAKRRLSVPGTGVTRNSSAAPRSTSSLLIEHQQRAPI